jgi:hypothetical protein
MLNGPRITSKHIADLRLYRRGVGLKEIWVKGFRDQGVDSDPLITVIT